MHLVLAFIVAALLAAGAPPMPARAEAEPPLCTGRDLEAELARQDPAAWKAALAKAEATSNARAILWRIEGRGLPPSHLFGTIHLTDDRVTTLSPAVSAALDGARTVALEVADLSPENFAASLAGMQSQLAFGDGRSLAAVLDAEEQAIARRALSAAGMPGAALETLKPWLVTLTMSLTDCERRRTATGLQPLDLRLAARARERGIPLAGLETLEEQLRALASVPDADQLVVLRAGLRLHHLNDDMIETMVRLYAARRIGAVWPLQEALWLRAGFEPAAFASFQRALLTQRNGRMRDAALPLIEKGGAFIAVGALHLPGPEGLVELIRKAGWTITAAE